MRRIWIVLLPFVLLTGCHSVMTSSSLTKNSQMSAQPMMVTTRPHEFGLETVGDARGRASIEKFLFFTISGDKPDVTLPVLGEKSKHPLETLACYRAAQSKGGDAFYVITSEWEKKNILGIYRKHAVVVTGKRMKIKDLGELDPERADKLINRVTNISAEAMQVRFSQGH